MGKQIKVGYVVRGGQWVSTAYIDDETFCGTDKYTNCDVELKWDEENGKWIQIDDFEWEFSPFTDPIRRK